MKISFAAIDGKDFAPVYVEDQHGECRREFTREQFKLVAMMDKEYLQRLRVLQDEIAAKYEPMIAAAEGQNLDNEAAWKAESEADDMAEKAFPGPYAPWYS